MKQPIKANIYQKGEYISQRYGNWQVPERNYNAGLHDGSIAEKGF